MTNRLGAPTTREMPAVVIHAPPDQQTIVQFNTPKKGTPVQEVATPPSAPLPNPDAKPGLGALESRNYRADAVAQQTLPRPPVIQGGEKKNNLPPKIEKETNLAKLEREAKAATSDYHREIKGVDDSVRRAESEVAQAKKEYDALKPSADRRAKNLEAKEQRFVNAEAKLKESEKHLADAKKFQQKHKELLTPKGLEKSKAELAAAQNEKRVLKEAMANRGRELANKAGPRGTINTETDAAHKALNAKYEATKRKIAAAEERVRLGNLGPKAQEASKALAKARPGILNKAAEKMNQVKQGAGKIIQKGGEKLAETTVGRAASRVAGTRVLGTTVGRLAGTGFGIVGGVAGGVATTKFIDSAVMDRHYSPAQMELMGEVARLRREEQGLAGKIDKLVSMVAPKSSDSAVALPILTGSANHPLVAKAKQNLIEKSEKEAAKAEQEETKNYRTVSTEIRGIGKPSSEAEVVLKKDQKISTQFPGRSMSDFTFAGTNAKGEQVWKVKVYDSYERIETKEATTLKAKAKGVAAGIGNLVSPLTEPVGDAIESVSSKAANAIGWAFDKAVGVSPKKTE